MRVYKEMGVASALNDSHEFVEARLLAMQGLTDQACRAALRYADAAESATLAIFARREAATWCGEVGMVDKAAELAEQCSAAGQEAWEAGDENLFVMRNSEMYWQGKAGRQRLAERLAHELVRDAELHLSPTDPLSFAIRNNAARIFEGSDTPDEAGDIYRRLVADQAKSCEEYDPAATATLHNYADYLADRGDLEDALYQYRRLLFTFTQFEGIRSFAALSLRHDVAATLVVMEQLDQARDLLEELYADCQRYLPEDSPLTLEAGSYLISLAVKRDNQAEVVRWTTAMIENHHHVVDEESLVSLVRLRNQALERAAT